jgi:hypothetical protein
MAIGAEEKFADEMQEGAYGCENSLQKRLEALSEFCALRTSVPTQSGFFKTFFLSGFLLP